MTSGSSHRAASATLLDIAALVAGLALPGCALSDDYHIDSGLDGDASSTGSGGDANTSLSGGTNTSSGDANGGSGGSGGTGAAGTGGETASNTGSGGTGGSGDCKVTCNTGRACPGGASCETGWVQTSTPPGGFSPREQAAYVSIGNELFIWGGLNESGTALDSGALYDPRTDTWTTIGKGANTPSPRSNASAVWTGTQVVVFGGFDPGDGQALADGGIYDPVDDEWLPMASATTPRSAPVGSYAQNRAIFWGGQDDDGNPMGGFVFYVPGSDTWEADDGVADPGALESPAVASGQQTFWLFGGRDTSNMTNEGGWYYSLNTFDWHDLDAATLEPRWGAFGAFTSLDFLVWGGRDLDQVFNDGARYSLAVGFGSNWGSIPSQGAPSPRYRSPRESGWTVTDGGQVYVIGGLDDPGSYLRDGGLYASGGVNPGWSDIEAWPGSASHAYGVVDFVAGELVVWGGRDGSLLTNTGVRYLHASQASALGPTGGGF